MFDWLTPNLIAILWACVKAVIILLSVVLSAAWMIWLERRLLALWQDRYGPNRIGPFGLGQVIADMIKIFFKEDWTPPFVDKFTFILAPALAMALMLLAFALVPITPNWGVNLDVKKLFLRPDVAVNSGAIMVSHSMSMVRALCTSAAVLHRGRLTYYSDVNEAIAVHQTNMGTAPGDDDDD